jgi:hypothetical protein
MHEAQNAKTKRSKQVRHLPGRAHPRQWTQDAAQREGCGVNQQPLGEFILAPQVHPPQTARLIAMGKRSLDQDPRRLIRALPVGVFGLRRLAYPAACAALWPAQHGRWRSGSAIRVRMPTSASSSSTGLLV